LPTEASASEDDLGLIEPGDLAMKSAGWAILDGRPRAEWTKGRLPGAHSFSWEDYTRTDREGVPYRIWHPHELAKVLGEMGIDEKTPVVVYGDADTSWGGEGWAVWTLAWLGHRGPVRLLDGGVQGWKAAGLSLEEGSGGDARPAATYRVTLREDLNISTADLEKGLDGVTLIDTRSYWEWFKGHLPGAVHIPWTDLFTGKENRPLSPRAYRALLAEKGVPTGRPAVFYCTGGIRSGYGWTVHRLSGLEGGRNYEGSTEAWERLSSDR